MTRPAVVIAIVAAGLALAAQVSPEPPHPTHHRAVRTIDVCATWFCERWIVDLGGRR